METWKIAKGKTTTFLKAESETDSRTVFILPNDDLHYQDAELIVTAVNSYESLKEQNDRMREALEWLKHHISQASIDKSVIKGIVEAALKS